MTANKNIINKISGHKRKRDGSTLLPRVLGAVGARCLHVKVLSKNSSLSFASEYFFRSSTF